VDRELSAAVLRARSICSKCQETSSGGGGERGDIRGRMYSSLISLSSLIIDCCYWPPKPKRAGLFSLARAGHGHQITSSFFFSFFLSPLILLSPDGRSGNAGRVHAICCLFRAHCAARDKVRALLCTTRVARPRARPPLNDDGEWSGIPVALQKIMPLELTRPSFSLLLFYVYEHDCDSFLHSYREREILCWQQRVHFLLKGTADLCNQIKHQRTMSFFKSALLNLEKKTV
jgi:hypothetical protein